MKDIIYTKLEALHKPIVVSGDDYILTTCFNPVHADTHPSFSINLNTGGGHCFGCGFSLPRDYFLDGELNEDELEELERGSKYHRLKTMYEDEVKKGYLIPPPKSEDVSDFRGILPENIEKFGIYLCNIGKYSNRIVFPFLEKGEYVGFTTRTLDTNSKNKYMHNKGFRVKQVLYPYDVLSNNGYCDYVVVTEGIIDTIILIQDGINSICNFGVANNFSKEKIAKLLSLGVEKIYLMFDKDEAGSNAEAIILADWSYGEYIEIESARNLKALNAFYESDHKDYSEFKDNL